MIGKYFIGDSLAGFSNRIDIDAIKSRSKNRSNSTGAKLKVFIEALSDFFSISGIYEVLDLFTTLCVECFIVCPPCGFFKCLLPYL